MTPQEKGDELIEKFVHLIRGETESTQQKRATRCAIIAVEEILNGSKILGTKAISRRKFWYEVFNYLKSKL